MTTQARNAPTPLEWDGSFDPWHYWADRLWYDAVLVMANGSAPDGEGGWRMTRYTDPNPFGITNGEMVIEAAVELVRQHRTNVVVFGGDLHPTLRAMYERLGLKPLPDSQVGLAAFKQRADQRGVSLDGIKIVEQHRSKRTVQELFEDLWAIDDEIRAGNVRFSTQPVVADLSMRGFLDRISLYACVLNGILGETHAQVSAESVCYFAGLADLEDIVSAYESDAGQLRREKELNGIREFLFSPVPTL